LKQPGKFGGVMNINKALYGQASGEAGVEWNATAVPQGKRPGAWPEKGDEEQIAIALQGAARDKQFLAEARKIRNIASITRYEQEVDKWEKALAVLQQSPGELTEAKAASEKVRKKLALNYQNAINSIAKAGLTNTAEHFTGAIGYSDYQWRYLPADPVAWSFEPESSAN
jgi:hypothetical protein